MLLYHANLAFERIRKHKTFGSLRSPTVIVWIFISFSYFIMIYILMNQT